MEKERESAREREGERERERELYEEFPRATSILPRY
jgi:hypothetical protein